MVKAGAVGGTGIVSYGIRCAPLCHRVLTPHLARTARLSGTPLAFARSAPLSSSSRSLTLLQLDTRLHSGHAPVS